VSDERTLGERALNEALSRLRERLNDSNIGDPMVSLAEVLEWCYTLEEYHVKRIGRPAYEAQRSASTDGQTEAGLIYARGLFTHSLFVSGQLVTRPPQMTYQRTGGRRGGAMMIVSGAVSAYHWKAFSDLPAPGKPERHGRDAHYQNHIAGQLLLPPLEAAVRFVVGVT
jgi:hypothetical protein